MNPFHLAIKVNLTFPLINSSTVLVRLIALTLPQVLSVCLNHAKFRATLVELAVAVNMNGPTWGHNLLLI